MDFTIQRENNRKIVFTEEQEQYILDSYLNHKKSIRSIAKQFGLAHESISRFLRKQGIDTTQAVTRYAWTQEQIDDIIARYVDRNQSLAKIASDYDVASDTIRLLLTNNKISIKSPNRLQWAQEDIEFIIEEYVSKRLSIVTLAEKYGVDPKSIKTILRDHDVPLYYNAGVETSKLMVSTKNYFASIETPEQAYWLGYLLADVGLYSGNHIKIVSKDLDVIEKFQNTLCAHTYEIDCNRQEKNFEYSLVIKNAQITKDLINYGFAIGGKRSKVDNNLALDLIPEEFHYDIVRGCFDKCGSIYFSDKRCSIQWVGNKNALTVIRTILEKEKISLSKSAADDMVYGFQVSGRETVKRILLEMYENSMPETRSDRKFKTVQQLLSSLGANTFEPIVN